MRKAKYVGAGVYIIYYDENKFVFRPNRVYTIPETLYVYLKNRGMVEDI